MGVVSGLAVSTGKGNAAGGVAVTPGCAIDPSGELITLCEPTRLQIQSTAPVVRVCLRYTERPADDAPVVTINPDSGPQPTRIVEGSELVLVDEAAGVANKLRRAVVENSMDVVLAKVVRTRSGWRVDRKFKVAQASRP